MLKTKIYSDYCIKDNTYHVQELINEFLEKNGFELKTIQMHTIQADQLSYLPVVTVIYEDNGKPVVFDNKHDFYNVSRIEKRLQE